MNQISFLHEKKCLTKHWWITLSFLLFCFAPFCLTWLLIGEVNLLNLYWFVPKNIVLWHGCVTNDNIGQLVENYQRFANDDLQIGLQQYCQKNEQIAIVSSFFAGNYLFIFPILIILVLDIVLPYLFYKCHLSHLDLYPFLISGSLAWIVFIVTGIIPRFKNYLVLFWLIRVTIALFIFFLSFVVMNHYFNVLIIKSKDSANFAFSYLQDIKTNKSLYNDLEQNIEQYRHKNKAESVEID